MIEYLTDAFQAGSTYLLIVITALAFLECMFGIGLFVSGIFLCLPPRRFTWREYPLWQITLAALIGAIVGDHAGYFIGRYSGQRCGVTVSSCAMKRKRERFSTGCRRRRR